LPSNQKTDLINLTSKNEFDSLIIDCPGYELLKIGRSDYFKDTLIYLSFKFQEIIEVEASFAKTQQISIDEMHVIQFHFNNGKLYTMEVASHKPKIKYLCSLDTCILVHPNGTLRFENIAGGIFYNANDSVYFENFKSIQATLCSKLKFDNDFHGFIGSIGEVSFFKESYFYNLINCYSSIEKDHVNDLAMVFDSANFQYIANQYYNVTERRDIKLRYTSPHPKAGKIFHNEENIWIGGMDKKGLQTFKYLTGSSAFLKLIAGMRLARSEGILLDSVLFVFDLQSFIYTTKYGIKTDFNLDQMEYKNHFSIDNTLKRVYFHFKKNGEDFILMVDPLNVVEKAYKAPIALSTIYHWECDNGFFYYLIANDPNTDWKRTLFRTLFL
jgi:hypothetical protein